MSFKNTFKLGAMLCAFGFLFSCSDDDNNSSTTTEEVVVVANRGANSITFIDATNDEVLQTLTIANSEPMYVVYVPNTDRIYVGDRAQNAVHVINPTTRTVEQSITVGEGVFHMWADGQGNQLWVANDIDDTISVINLSTNAVVQTITVGEQPHDVFVTEDASKAYVSVIVGDATVADSIFMYSTNDYSKTASVGVGDDPHLYHLNSNNRLYSPNQSGEMFVLNGDDLSEIAQVSLEGAHGIFPGRNNAYMYVTNLPGGQLFSVNTSDNMLNGTALDTTVAVPHNVVVNNGNNKLFVTHSGGSANQVTVYTLSNGTPTLSATITAGTNPFGLAYYSRTF